jgi:hypothetical protein
VLFALPMVAVIGSISAPVPTTWPDRLGGALLFLVLLGSSSLVRFDRPAVGRRPLVGNPWIFGKIHRPGGPTAAGLVHQRDAMVDALGSRWEMALATAVGNWVDYRARHCAHGGGQARLSSCCWRTAQPRCYP